jgi:hypothetical protein
LLIELADLLQMVEKLTTVDEVHDQVEMLFVLKRKLKLHDEGVVELRQNVTLSCNYNYQGIYQLTFYALDLIRRDDHMFFNSFHGVVFCGLYVLHQINFSVRATAHHLDQFKV